MKHHFFSDCVCWPRDKTNALRDMIDDARDVTRSTFLRHVHLPDLRRLENGLGYTVNPAHGMTMASDWHVSYHRSRLNGFTVYYFRQSSIEYVFVPENFTWERQSCLT